MNINPSEKRWILLEQPGFQFPKRIWLLLFLYSLSFTLLLVGLRYFHADNDSQKSGITTEKSIGADSVPQNDTNKEHIADSTALQSALSDKILRLHVIANSDADADQNIKYEVRDSIIFHLQNSLKHASSLQDAEKILQSQKSYIQETAEKTVRNHQYDYEVNIYLEDRYFPAKQYGDLTFPPGTYRALCVEIGEAQGRNWWCVLFPCLCFVDGTTAVVPEQSKERLQSELSEDDYNCLLSQDSLRPTESPKPKVQFRSGIYEWITGK